MIGINWSLSAHLLLIYYSFIDHYPVIFRTINANKRENDNFNDLKFDDRNIKLFFNVISTLGGENRQDMMMPILQDLMESTLLQLSDHTYIYINPNDMIIRIIIFILITVVYT